MSYNFSKILLKNSFPSLSLKMIHVKVHGLILENSFPEFQSILSEVNIVHPQFKKCP